MKTILQFAIVPAVVIAGVAFLVHAQDASKEREKGTVLLLKTGHAMEGDIARLGAQYCVRRGTSEVLIAADLAVRLCADWDDAYAYAQTLIKTDDAKARVQLARWCHLNRMSGKALEQARKALELEPANSDAKQMVLLMERVLRAPPPKPAPIPKVAPEPVVEPTPAVDVSFETYIAFTKGVQPILMNTCAACHATSQGGQFRLERVSEANKKATTQRNLAAVLAHIDLERPAISPLLVKAITPHGGSATPAIRDRAAKPLQSMQQWIEETIAKNPQLKDYAAAKKPAPAPLPAQVKTAATPVSTAAPAAWKGEVVSQIVSPTQTGVTSKQAVAHAPTETPPPDEFAAEHFNRQFHPKR